MAHLIIVVHNYTSRSGPGHGQKSSRWLQRYILLRA